MKFVQFPKSGTEIDRVVSFAYSRHAPAPEWSGQRIAWRFTDHRDIPQEEKDRGHYPYIPFNHSEFVAHMQILLSHPALQEARTFIDVGCGIADKLLLMAHFTDAEVHGIEYAQRYLDIARAALGRKRRMQPFLDNLKQGDAFEHDFAPYDLIYMYHPIMNHERMWALFLHIARTAKNGAVITEMLESYQYTALGAILHGWHSDAGGTTFPVTPEVEGLLAETKERGRMNFRKKYGRCTLIKQDGALHILD
jgi:SAM-dependent methyltransferase